MLTLIQTKEFFMFLRPWEYSNWVHSYKNSYKKNPINKNELDQYWMTKEIDLSSSNSTPLFKDSGKVENIEYYGKPLYYGKYFLDNFIIRFDPSVSVGFIRTFLSKAVFSVNGSIKRISPTCSDWNLFEFRYDIKKGFGAGELLSIDCQYEMFSHYDLKATNQETAKTNITCLINVTT